MEIKLSPSILSADFANLARDIKIATDAGAEYVHVDVMDGHFVPNITIGAPVVKSLRKATDKVLDVHLMISDPDQYLDDFIKAGSDIITVHYESNGDTLEQLKKIRADGLDLVHALRNESLTAEARLYGHDEHHVAVRQQREQRLRRSFRLDDTGRLDACRADLLQLLGGIRRRHRGQRQEVPRGVRGRRSQGVLDEVNKLFKDPRAHLAFRGS